jgi:hypothetical protein
MKPIVMGQLVSILLTKRLPQRMIKIVAALGMSLKDGMEITIDRKPDPVPPIVA